jgi:hypothetical protein
MRLIWIPVLLVKVVIFLVPVVHPIAMAQREKALTMTTV